MGELAATPKRDWLTAENLSVGYGPIPTVRDTTLTIENSRFTALLGPNGSGKSTLLAAFSRLLPAQSGAVLLDGQDIAGQPTRLVARKLGLLPQQPPVPDGISVFELVSRGRFPYQGFLREWSPEDEKAVAEAMRLTDVDHLAARPVETLSGGQRQRVWIAMALAQQTPLLLLDEPTTFLDVAHQIAILDLLRRLVSEHRRTIVCVLHDLNMALQYADRLIFLKDGAVRHRLADPAECTEAIVDDVFDLNSIIVPHPQTGRPVVLPRSPGIERGTA